MGPTALCVGLVAIGNGGGFSRSGFSRRSLGDDLCWTKKSYAASRGFIAARQIAASLPAEKTHALRVNECTDRLLNWSTTACETLLLWILSPAGSPQPLARRPTTPIVASPSQVSFQAKADGRKHTFRIVGEDEADPPRGTMSDRCAARPHLRARGTVEMAGDTSLSLPSKSSLTLPPNACSQLAQGANRNARAAHRRRCPAQSIELMLKVDSFNVYTTGIGEEGIDLGKIYDYDIILLDLSYPTSSASRFCAASAFRAHRYADPDPTGSPPSRTRCAV